MPPINLARIEEFMSGWRIAACCAIPLWGVLFFLKLIAESLSSTAVYLEDLEAAEERAWVERRQDAMHAARAEATKA